MGVSKVGGADYTDSDKNLVANGKAQVDEFKKTDPQMLFVICRSKNLNLVAYEVQFKKDENGEFVKQDGKYVLNEDDPVNGYWITGEPSYKEQNKKDGIDDRRSDLSFFERKFAYGVSASKNADGVYIAKLSPVDKPLTLVFDEEGKAVAKATLNGVECTITHIFVKSVERSLLPPKCLFVDVYGVDAEGNVVIERLLP